MQISHRTSGLNTYSRPLLLVILATFLAAASCSRTSGAKMAPNGKRVIVLGIDGMDPQLLEKFVADGKMPHFASLIQTGGLHKLGTSTPAQSPVAWSSLITGMNPGGHGIFDFIHRDPKTMIPYLSTSKVEAPTHTVRLGSWVLPLWGGGASLLRQGKAFWEYLDGHGIPATIYRMPANFPPVEAHSRSFAGMGTPDLLGTYGTFSFYTDDLLAPYGAVDGGRIYPVELKDGRVTAKLAGPYNTLRAGDPQVTVDFTVDVDPVQPVAKMKVQDHVLVLREGEWSNWLQVRFDLLPHLESVTGICKVYLKQTHPRFQLYVTPINIDPSQPALPLSAPEDYSRELWEEMGFFYTQGIAEDTKALSRGVLSDREYLDQARMVLAEQMKAFDLELPKFTSGLFFFYFSSLDLNSHMFWRAMDPNHPEYRPESVVEYSGIIEGFYREMDAALGKAMDKADSKTTLLVLSDHGFAPYYRSFNLNTWLRNHGYLALKEGKENEPGGFFANVDWARTRAYGLGLNGLYLNLRGRERDGIVEPGAEANGLLAEITTRLFAIRDGAAGNQVISRIDSASEVYHGPYEKNAPDLLVGYNRGYRAGWATVLGGFTAEEIEDNQDPWSGDHCMDPSLVPGVLLSNRKIAAQAPSLTDIAPTILSLFGIRKPAGMTGDDVLGN